MMQTETDIAAIAENFELLDDWEDRYRYLIDLGGNLQPLRETERTDANKVQGCASQVWLICERSGEGDPVLVFRGDSDAHIVRGLIAIILAIFSGRRASAILADDERRHFDRLRLKEHISAQRSNGLRSMVARIKRYAHDALPAQPAGAMAGR